MQVPPGLHDIAWQMINNAPGKNINVLFGGGRAAFYPESANLGEQDPSLGPSWDCYRQDGLRLADQWLTDHGARAYLVEDDWHDHFPGEEHRMEYALGLLSEGFMPYTDEADFNKVPRLSEMAKSALRILMKDNERSFETDSLQCCNEAGFFLMVEAGRIDHAHHYVYGRRALEETLELNAAVDEVIKELEKHNMMEDTLIIVTADHSHTMAQTGYIDRGNDIAGLSGEYYQDDMPYTSIAYANGPSFYDYYFPTADGKNVTRLDLSEMSEDEIADYSFRQVTGGISPVETHSGDDVGIFAQGPLAHLFHTTHDQTHIGHVMAYSACIGPYKDDPVRCPSKAAFTVLRINAKKFHSRWSIIQHRK